MDSIFRCDPFWGCYMDRWWDGERWWRGDGDGVVTRVAVVAWLGWSEDGVVVLMKVAANSGRRLPENKVATKNKCAAGKQVLALDHLCVVEGGRRDYPVDILVKEDINGPWGWVGLAMKVHVCGNLENPFVVPATIEIIKSFMHKVGHQGVMDKVSAFSVKNLAQPWQTTFKKKDVIQYPHFTKLIITDLMKKYPSISPRLEKDYHSIKDHISLVSVYTTRNVTVQGMLIPNAFLTEEIHTTNDYKEYKTVYSRAHRTPNLIAASPQWKKRKQSVVETSSPQKSLNITIKQKQVVEGEKVVEPYADKFVASMIHDNVDDSRDRIKSGSHKEHLEVVIVDDDDNKEEKKDEKEDDEMASLETRTEMMQTQIPTTSRSLRINLSSVKIIVQELTNTVPLKTATASKDLHKKRRISNKYSHLQGALYSTTYVSKKQQEQQEWDAREEKIVIYKDEVIFKDETPELIIEFQNVDKRVSTIFDRAKKEATLNDMLINQFRNAKEYAYHLEQATNFMENQIV
nr:hypothetical protein [Tanacetum cinerariifolium]